MDIRSLTLFCNPDVNPSDLKPFFDAARPAFHVSMQTVRVATTPFPEWLPDSAEPDLSDWVAAWQSAGAAYIALGPVQRHHNVRWLDTLLALVAANDAVFGSVEIADHRGRIDVQRIHATAQLIRQLSTTHDNGFGNLYVTAIANCPPNIPFFPVAYHGGGPPAFALAVESADLALSALRAARSLDEARAALIASIEGEMARLAEMASRLSAEFGIPFLGIDCSLAPFPTADKSIGGALERLGIAHLGAPGSLFAAAFVTDALQRARFKRCGFNGLMLPVLEDSVLAARAGSGQLTLPDLLSYSAVCGVGLDTVPLPGDVDESVLAGILLDVAALATRLNKPLTARLMPMPGLAAGDPLTFDFPYFADSQVMSVARRGAVVDSAETDLRPYHT